MDDGEGGLVPDQTELYTLAADRPAMDGPVLIYHLEGFMDAGGAGRLAVQHLLTAADPGTAAEPRTVATFDVDRLIDYRSRRPPMSFDTDHWVGYDAPELTVEALEDAVGAPFLVMTGPEPDHEWERFATAVTSLIDELGVRLSIGIHGIPMATPHTRATGLTPHGNRKDLFGEHPAWITEVQVPGSASALIEYRLAESGHDVLGFAAHVPHYLSQAEYPPASLAILEAVTAATGLVFSNTPLHEAAEQAKAEIDDQVTASTEISDAVRELEQQFDAITTATKGARPLTGDPVPMPTADEIGAEFERFLAEQDDDE
jgi:predicted ATP-grasp superfamily ATP-dependent carboligase